MASSEKKQVSLFKFFQQKSQDQLQASAASSQVDARRPNQEPLETAEDREWLKRGGKPHEVPAKPSAVKIRDLGEEAPEEKRGARRTKKFIDDDESQEEVYAPDSKAKKTRTKREESEEEYKEDSDVDEEMVEDKPRKAPVAAGGKKQTAEKGKIPRKTTKQEQEADQLGVNQIEDSNLGAGKKVDEKGNVNLELFDDPTPWWALKENRLDGSRRKPEHPDFDPTSLYIPPDEVNKLTPAKRQFWLIKSKNFEKVIFFKLGKFYELFDQDAVLGVQVLGLAFMGNKMHAGVPEASLDKYAERLVQMGYKVGIVEQTETERERKTRVSTGPSKAQEKVLKRDMTRVLTKGTYISPLEDAPKLNSNYLWVVRSFGESYGICITELSLNLSWVGFVERDENYSQLKMLIYQLKPNEIVCDFSYLNRDIQKIFSNISSNPLISKVCGSERSGFWNNLTMGETHRGQPFLANLEKVVASAESDLAREAMRSVFAGFVSYLESIKILELHIDILSIRKYEEAMSFKQRMVLDSQALEQLEVIEATHDFRTKRDDSLLHCLDRCVSLPGKRLLKSMLCAPFLDLNTINDRLDAIEDLNRNPVFIREFQKFLQKAGDLERVLARLFKFSVRQKSRVVMFEDVSAIRLRELKTVFDTLSKLQDLLTNSQASFEWTSALMKSFTTTEEHGGLLKQNIKEEIKDIQSNILWVGENANFPVPREGINPDYDRVKLQIREVERELEAYLQDQKKALGCASLEFAHAKSRYEISAPDNLKVPSSYSFSSMKKGAKRYTTPRSMQLVDKMEAREDELKEYMKEFALYIFEYFNKKRGLWENIVNVSKEIDVLCSLALYSFHSRGDFCRPRLFGEDHKPFLELTASRHPIVSQLFEDFIPNDIRLGARSGDQIILLTGPNMGGKSTILRQACLITIMAQIGCYVPAQACELTAVDRIFTRLGANDKLVEGKSTFFIEMEDIYNLVNFGSDRSLAIIDELGRGTSTADGYAIAASILDHMARSIGCLSIFSTHYHSLINFSLDYDAISFWKMDYLLDESNHNIVFLYKLVEGICNRSFGIKIGRLAGIDDAILRRAEEISQQIDKSINRNFRDEIDRKFEVIHRALQENQDLSKVDLGGSN